MSFKSNAVNAAVAKHLSLVVDHACLPRGAGGSTSRQGDRGLVASNSLMKRITITAPDDNHVIITMPIADSTKPAVAATSSQSSSNAGDHAAPSDSAYSADALPPSQMSQPQPGADHDSAPEQWQQQQQQQQQQQLGRQQAEGPPDGDRHQPPQSEVPHQLAGLRDASNRSSAAEQQQQVHQQAMQQPAGRMAASLVSEPSGLVASGTNYDKQISHRQQESVQQQQQVARSSRSYTNMGRKHLQKRPGRKQPQTESTSGSSFERTSAPASVNPSEWQAGLHRASANGASVKQSNESELGPSPKLGGEGLIRNQQLDALQEQLHGLVQASQGINESLLRVHQQIEFIKSR